MQQMFVLAAQIGLVYRTKYELYLIIINMFIQMCTYVAVCKMLEQSLLKCVRTPFAWDRSFSEPDLIGAVKGFNRFLIKNPHEYISVDDLKFFRRKKPPDLHTKSNICLYNSDEPVLPFGCLKSEYRKHFQELDFSLRPKLLRRSTSLRLEGLMHYISENHDKYHWYTPEDCEISRSYPVRYPESFQLGTDAKMDGEYRSSYISYPMVDRTMKILPREVFRIDPEPVQQKLEVSREEVAAMSKLAEDKFKRDVAARENAKCHLQQRAAESSHNAAPSEYTRQYVQFPIEKAHSIPQISHIKMGGNFDGVAEYRDSFRMYANYSKSAPIKKIDNLRMSGAEEVPGADDRASDVVGPTELPEYREKFGNPPKEIIKEKSLKTEDHLHTHGKFSSDLPEYFESFRDPQVKDVPERGKCREPYLRLKGKIEFNPEYRNTYLDFPRSRPIVNKPVSSLRLPISSTSSTEYTRSRTISPRHKTQTKSGGPITDSPTSTDLTITPEYRRAHYNYQIRERTPTKYEGNQAYQTSTPSTRKGSDTTKQTMTTNNNNKRRSMRSRQASVLDPTVMAGQTSNFENISNSSKKPARFGRRASVLQNASNCRGNSSIIEGNPKYSSPDRRARYQPEGNDSFVVLKDPCKETNWMKKTWFES